MRKIFVVLRSKSSFEIYNLQSIVDAEDKDISKTFLEYNQLVIFKGAISEAQVNSVDIEYVIIEESK